jgi:hypothetical protein
VLSCLALPGEDSNPEKLLQRQLCCLLHHLGKALRLPDVTMKYAGARAEGGPSCRSLLFLHIGDRIHGTTSSALTAYPVTLPHRKERVKTLAGKSSG